MRLPLFLVFLLLFSAESIEAGRLYARKAGTASPLYNLRQLHVETNVSIRNLLAVTHVDETFLNTAGVEVEAWYVFQLPEGAVVDGLWLWVNNERRTFTVKRRELAQQAYDSLSRTPHADPAILETMGANRFQLRLANIREGEMRRIELRYFQELPVNAEGYVRYVYPLNMAAYQSAPVEQLTLRIDIHTDAPLDSVRSNADDRPLLLTRTTVSDRKMQVRFSGEEILENTDFRLDYRVRGWTDSLFTLCYSETESDSSFFMMWYAVTMDEISDEAMDIVFAVDASASMTGLRSDVVLAALDELLGALQPNDRFRIIFFNNKLLSYPPDTSLLFATAEHVQAGRAFIHGRYDAMGITRYDHALLSLSDASFRREADKRCIFITDGLPIHGLRAEGVLLPMLQTRDGLIRFFPISVWAEPAPLLESLARSTEGMYSILDQGDDLQDALRRVTFTFGNKYIRDAWISFPSMLPEVFSTVYLLAASTANATACGLFIDEGLFDCTLSLITPGSVTPRPHKRKMRLYHDTAGVVQVARYWASKRIAQLLSNLADVTDSTEIREEIILLSEKYMVLSPFTAFLVYNEKKDDGSLAIGELSAPVNWVLHQNYPNPFTLRTTISYTLPDDVPLDGTLSVRLYDASGRMIRVLYHGDAHAGRQFLFWDGRDEGGRPLPAGIYHCVLEWKGRSSRITMILIK